MARFKLILLALLFCCFFSVNSYAQKISPADQNTQVIVEYYSLLNKNFASFKMACRHLLAKNAYLDYQGQHVNFFKNIDELQKAFPDHHTGILNIIAEGNQVFVRTETRAIQTEPLMGIEATHKPITIIASNIFYFNDQHQIIYMTQLLNEINIMEQLGYIILQ